MNRCEICNRETNNLEKHHLDPKNRKKSPTIDVCMQCGDQIHLMFDNSILSRELNSVEKIVSNEKMIKYIKWVRKQPITRKSTRKLKRKK